MYRFCSKGTSTSPRGRAFSTEGRAGCTGDVDARAGTADMGDSVTTRTGDVPGLLHVVCKLAGGAGRVSLL